MKVLKLKNRFTGEIVFCKNINDTSEGNGITFIKVWKEENPQRIFLVNREAFSIVG